jgi:demethylmenaquinone methyltransferase/2-methoxy-6-polyprenyl-1,4-benzoquinol methylase
MREARIVEQENTSASKAILPVSRTKAEARRFYDRISHIYGWMTGAFERKHGEEALELLSIRDGETALEIGIGSGHCFQQMAGLVGDGGSCCGVDISTGMLEVTKNRLLRSGLAAGAGLCCADAAQLPFRDNSCDAILMAFTLELFDTPEIPQVLSETRRVLKPGGRIAVVSLSKEGQTSTAMRLYEWAHLKWPRYADCRPIYVERSMTACGYTVRSRVGARMAGLPLETILANKPEPTALH